MGARPVVVVVSPVTASEPKSCEGRAARSASGPGEVLGDGISVSSRGASMAGRGPSGAEPSDCDAVPAGASATGSCVGAETGVPGTEVDRRLGTASEAKTAVAVTGTAVPEASDSKTAGVGGGAVGSSRRARPVCSTESTGAPRKGVACGAEGRSGGVTGPEALASGCGADSGAAARGIGVWARGTPASKGRSVASAVPSGSPCRNGRGVASGGSAAEEARGAVSPGASVEIERGAAVAPPPRRRLSDLDPSDGDGSGGGVAASGCAPGGVNASDSGRGASTSVSVASASATGRAIGASVPEAGWGCCPASGATSVVQVRRASGAAASGAEAAVPAASMGVGASRGMTRTGGVRRSAAETNSGGVSSRRAPGASCVAFSAARTSANAPEGAAASWASAVGGTSGSRVRGDVTRSRGCLRRGATRSEWLRRATDDG